MKCEHKHLSFKDHNSYELECLDCPARWKAIVANADVFDSSKLNEHQFSPNRSSPFALPRIDQNKKRSDK